MKQILQSLKSGTTEVAEVPCPAPSSGQVLIRTSHTLVSAGTERMLIEFGKANLLDKARQQPEKVRQAMQKIRTEGVICTVEAIRAKLDQPLALGYCNVGSVMAAGLGVEGIAPGMRVASNGRHAEFVAVTRNLAAAVPDAVSDEAASFSVLGAIALQGVRLAAPTIGEAFVVTGLGLIGLMAVQMLKANGCRVLGIDSNPQRLRLARRFGAETVDLARGESPLDASAAFSRGRGVDGVLLCASTDSNEPVSQAARMCRKRGRIVLVGVTGLELSRAEFYDKELTFQVSCSYGPGRYDPNYEEKGHDYPLGLVRWTAQRNFEAVLDLLASGALDVLPLITHRYDIDQADEAYRTLANDRSALGIVICYPERGGAAASKIALRKSSAGDAAQGKAVAGFIGAGSYGGRFLIKAFADAGAKLDTVVSATGVSATHYGRKFGFLHAASDAGAVLGSDAIDTVVISTRHDCHARFVVAALESGKNVFVEKPLCLTLAELAEIEAVAARDAAPRLMIGFNRRFAPMVVGMKALLDSVPEPKSFLITVNAGAIANDHWTQDPAVGGGRILGEACHFIDLLRHLAGSPIRSFEVTGLARAGGPPRTDVATITLRFEDGSFGVINYLANGHKAFPKERFEVFCAGRILILQNFRWLRGHGWPCLRAKRAWSPDKGQTACVDAFVSAIRSGKPSPIPLPEIVEVTRVSIEAAALAG